MIEAAKKRGRPIGSRKPTDARFCVYCGAEFMPPSKASRTCSASHRMAVAGDEKRGVKSYGPPILANEEGRALLAAIMDVPRRTNQGGATSAEDAVFDWREIPCTPSPKRPDIGTARPSTGIACRFSVVTHHETAPDLACKHPSRSLARHLIGLSCIDLRCRNLCPWGRP